MNDVNKLLLEAARFKPDESTEPSAWLGHLQFAGFIVAAHRPKVIVELGTHRGQSYFAFCKAVLEHHVDARCYAVDTWQGDEHAGHYGDEIFTAVNAHNHEHYASFSSLMRMTFDEARNYFPDGSIELLHIDGLHTYEAVKHDFETWLPKLAPGAIVLFHDTNVREREFGVWQFWDELGARYPANLNFKHSYGLGVLQLPGAAAGRQLDWLLAKPEHKALLLDYFSTLASHGEKRRELLLTRLELQTQVEAFARFQASAHHDIAQLQTEKAALELQIGEANRVIHHLTSSTSWKLTKPVRLLGRSLSGVRGKLKMARIAIQQIGGVGPAYHKARHAFRVDGWKGVQGLLNRANKKYRPGQIVQNDYQEWVRVYDTLTAEKIQVLCQATEGLKNKPLVSVIVPVYNANIEWLRAAIESVQAQIYPHWELCLADDASTNAEVRPFLESMQKEDSRIKVAFREKNGHISACSNSALDLAAGEWVALLDQDDLLPADALFWVAKAVNDHPDCQMIYTDEDKVNESGDRHGAYFKSDWNLYLFRSQNMFSHLGAYRRDLVESVGRFREGYEGSQDYDLALRCYEQIQDQQVIHIPRVLYHWRVHKESTAGGAAAKPYAAVAGERSLGDHLTRSGVDATVEYGQFGYRVHYALPAELPKVSIIIPTRNGLNLLQDCIESIFHKTTYSNYEIIVVDNGSTEMPCLEYLKKLQTRHDNVRVLRDDRPFNYSALNNAAVAHASGSIVALLNNDIEVISPDWLSEMVSIVLQPGVGAVGAKLLYPDGTVQHAGVILGKGGVAGHAHVGCAYEDPGYFSRISLIGEYSALTAACLVVKKKDYEAVSGLNEADLAVAFNDVDFCLKLKALGLRNVYTPYAELFHRESATRGEETNPEKLARFNREITYMMRTWPKQIACDPLYSPNLSLSKTDYTLAWPPRLVSPTS